MKKLLLILSVMASIVYADGGDCSEAAQKVVDKLAAHNRTSVTLNYSADNATKAKACQSAITAKNSAITVTMNQVQGTNQFKFSK